MRHIKLLGVAVLLGLAACASFVLAPGAAQVRVTNTAGDVVGCAPVGNLRVPQTGGALDHNSVGHLQNQTVGLGGNVAFVTDGTLRMPKAGVAYRCPAGSAGS